MFQYPNLLRIRYDHIAPAIQKRYFENPKDVFSQEVVVTEKVDGSQMAVGCKGNDGIPYLQGKNSHIGMDDKRKAYYGAWSWAWAHQAMIQKLKGYLAFGEWVRVQHSLPYDELPDWWIGFDVYDLKNKRFLAPLQAIKFLKEIGFATVPVLHVGKIKQQDVLKLVEGRKSNFLSFFDLQKTAFSAEELEQIRRERFADGKAFMEGCVIKSKDQPKFSGDYWSNCGKVVTREFLDCFSEDSHWTSERMRENKLKEWQIVKQEANP